MQKIIIQLTDEQYDALVKIPTSADGDRSKMIRRLIKDECKRHSITFLDNMPAPSRKRKITGEQS